MTEGRISAMLDPIVIVQLTDAPKSALYCFGDDFAELERTFVAPGRDYLQ